MDLYQLIFLILKLMGFVLFVWIIWNFSIAIFQSVEIFVKKLSSSGEEIGWEMTFKAFFMQILHSFFSFFLLISFVCLFPVGYIILKHFIMEVAFGKMSMGQFIQRIPEINSSVANFYSSYLNSIWLFFQRFLG